MRLRLKYFFLLIVICCAWNYSVFAQSELSIGFETIYECADLKNYDKIVIEKDANFQLGDCKLEITELVVYGTITSGKSKISCKTLTIDGGKWLNSAKSSIEIESNFIVKGAATIGDNSSNSETLQFSVGEDLIFNGNSTLNACELEVKGNMTIGGTVEIAAKKGTKKINGNLTINVDGKLKNTENENIEISGDFSNYGIIEKGNFTLSGLNKNLYGDIDVDRLVIAGEYTNNGTVEIHEEFTGNGVFTQGANSLLITHAPTSPELIASAEGNKVSYIRKGVIEINCAEFYDIECSTTYNLTKNYPSFTLAQSTTILGSLNFTQECFLNLDTCSLTFPKWTEQSLLFENLETGGIIIAEGAIIINDVESSNSIHLPLYNSTDYKDFAHVILVNNDEKTADFEIKQYDNITLAFAEFENSFCNEMMYEISTHCEAAQISLYWHSLKESNLFDRNKSKITMFDKEQWISLDGISSAQLGDYESTYFQTGNYSGMSINSFVFGVKSDSFLPVCLTDFTVTKQNNNNLVTWETASEKNCDYFELQSSFDGVNFTTCAHVEGNGSTNDTHTYSFCDTDFSNGITYYKLLQYDYDGTLWESSVIAIFSQEKNITAELIRSENMHFMVQTLSNETCFACDSFGRIVAVFSSNTEFDFSNFKQGIYFAHTEKSKILNNCIVVH